MQHEKPKPGRPLQHPEQDAPMDNYNVRLTAWHARKGRKLGNGNLSEGVRVAIETVVQQGTVNNKDESK